MVERSSNIWLLVSGVWKYDLLRRVEHGVAVTWYSVNAIEAVCVQR